MISRILSLFALLFGALPWVAAQSTIPALDAMVATENAFIKMAKDKNTRDAFFFFLHDDAVTVGAYGLVIGKEYLRKEKPDPTTLLAWEVSFSDISSAGDLGYNVGPWTFFAHRSDSVPVAWGHFHSIWKKQADGSWKNMLDMGVTHDSLTVAEPFHTSAKPLKAPTVKTSALEATLSLMNQEKAFLEAVKLEGMQAYRTVASKEIRFARQGEQPIVTDADKVQFLKRKSLYSNQVLTDGGIAASGDLGYVYGTADIMTTVDDRLETKRAAYLRVWKKEDANGWKIVLDVLTYK